MLYFLRVQVLIHIFIKLAHVCSLKEVLLKNKINKTLFIHSFISHSIDLIQIINKASVHKLCLIVVSQDSYINN